MSEKWYRAGNDVHVSGYPPYYVARFDNTDAAQLAVDSVNSVSDLRQQLAEKDKEIAHLEARIEELLDIYTGD